MGSPATIDHDRLLAPISDENPAGEDLRADTSPSSAYYLVKDARKAARAKERSAGLDNTDSGADREARAEIPDTRTDWRPVFEQSVALLTERSKDLELVAWLIESLVRLHGFAGLRDGFRFARAFATSYWDSFYPLLDDGGVEDRVASLSGLNGQEAEGTLIVPIRNVPITEEHSNEQFASWHYQQAVSTHTGLLEAIDKASLETDEDFLRRQYEDLQECRTEFDELTAVLDELCGAKASPPSSNIKNELNACLEAVKYVGKRAIVEASPEQTEETDGEDSNAENGTTGKGTASASPVSGGPPMNREQAFQQLLQLAEFFRKTEPHSPLSYTIERVVRWGRMPLPELLGEIITEDDARKNLFWLAGIKNPGASDSGE